MLPVICDGLPHRTRRLRRAILRMALSAQYARASRLLRASISRNSRVTLRRDMAILSPSRRPRRRVPWRKRCVLVLLIPFFFLSHPSPGSSPPRPIPIHAIRPDPPLCLLPPSGR
ncbi:hypothetical protein DFH08DRAFT_972953 [Mycena albidolilacea]|uniref:Uncharacterized protein n=1 Tax=Mycena albidolilacea TaxID=1033008 RepID=A0AAD6ZAI6_9AGAR|nr:hypothetical protein DFH08DRAFT_972953 [Mycena albidolilacea]